MYIDLKHYKRSKLGLEYFGIDSCSGFIEMNKKEYPDANFYTGSVEALPFKNSQFDVVVCQAVLEHVADV
jgi:ubiquinone/menaquinone biosynthesis C-methylase UbiE